jgi:hypothetical protein
MSTMTETTLSDMKGGFPPSPKPIQGIPMLQSLIKLLFHLCHCAQTQRLPASVMMNLLFYAAPRDVYAFLTTEAYPDAFAPFPPKVPNVPDYTVCIDNKDHARVWATHAQNKKTQADIVMMNSALANAFLEAMSSQVHASSQQRHLREPNIVFVDLFLWFVNQYGKTTAKDPEAKRQRLAADRHPANGFDTLILRLFTNAAYASSTGYRMNNIDIVDIGLRIIKQCGMYGKEYKAWIAYEPICPRIVETVNTFKTFWAAKITLMNQTTIPASMHGYGMVAVNNDDSVALYRESIANFGAAYAATQEAVRSQGTTIASMQGQMEAMQQYCMVIGQQPPISIYTSQQQQHGRRSMSRRPSTGGKGNPALMSYQQLGGYPGGQHPAKAAHPVQNVQKLELLPYVRRGCQQQPHRHVIS